MKHCLVVDDSSVIRKVARRILEQNGFEIVEAENGQEAFERCQQNMPDVVLLDWDMPVMGAMEFMSALKHSVNSQKRPIIFYCTTENDPVEISNALASGAKDFILKPFDRAAIEAKLMDCGLV